MDNFWKDKKIIAYIALLHHTRFIIPVMEKLADLGAEVRYVVAQAERSQEITAVTCNLDYTHVFDYLGDDDFKEIQNNYLRERRVFQQSLTNDFSLGSQMVTVMDKTLYAAAQEYVGFRNLMRKERPDLCFALHEVNRWGKIFSFWAKKFNVPFITLQEGLGYNASFGYTGHVQYSTLDLVWGDRIRKKFSNYEAPVERIIPVGNTHISREKRYQKENNIRGKLRKKIAAQNKFLLLLLFSATLPPQKEILPIINEVGKQADLKIIIKYHPACRYQTYRAWEKGLPDPLKKNLIFIHNDESTYDLMSASDLCVLAQPSTTGIEAVALDKPLVQLSLSTGSDVPYSFVDQKVALGMTPQELADALARKENFSNRFAPRDIERFLKNELTETTGASDRIISIMEKTISANKMHPFQKIKISSPPEYDWSFIIPVPSNSPKDFLFQLQSITETSENTGTYEVILVVPHLISKDTEHVLSSLTGNLTRVDYPCESDFFTAVNQMAGDKVKGRHMVIFSSLACPLPGWLRALKNGVSRWGVHKIFGGKILNRLSSIIHAGMVLNKNNAPVSAYRHLEARFPQANQERPFQMVDHMVAMSADFFGSLGGFSPETGSNAFMDICLKAARQTKDKTTCIFLPEMEFVKTTPETTPDPEHSVSFYARWHGTLWESEHRLYEKDGMTLPTLNAARMGRAQELAGRQ